MDLSRNLWYVFSLCDSELASFWLVKFAILLFSVLLLLKYERCWVGGVLKICGLWKNMFCGTGCWGWLCIIVAWINICMDLQKVFPKSAIDWEVPCNDSAKTRFDSCNVSANVLRNFVSSFASCNSSWSLCATEKVFSKCFRLLSINLGTWFSSDLRFADELCLIGSFSITESVYTFDKSSTRLPPFDKIMNTAAAAAVADDDKAAANEVAHFYLMMILVLH